MEANSQSKKKEGRNVNNYLHYIIYPDSHINYELRYPDCDNPLFWEQGLNNGRTLTNLIIF